MLSTVVLLILMSFVPAHAESTKDSPNRSDSCEKALRLEAFGKLLDEKYGYPLHKQRPAHLRRVPPTRLEALTRTLSWSSWGPVLVKRANAVRLALIETMKSVSESEMARRSRVHVFRALARIGVSRSDGRIDDAPEKNLDLLMHYQLTHSEFFHGVARAVVEDAANDIGFVDFGATALINASAGRRTRLATAIYEKMKHIFETASTSHELIQHLSLSPLGAKIYFNKGRREKMIDAFSESLLQWGRLVHLRNLDIRSRPEAFVAEVERSLDAGFTVVGDGSEPRPLTLFSAEGKVSHVEPGSGEVQRIVHSHWGNVLNAPEFQMTNHQVFYRSPELVPDGLFARTGWILVSGLGAAGAPIFVDGWVGWALMLGSAASAVRSSMSLSDYQLGQRKVYETWDHQLVYIEPRAVRDGASQRRLDDPQVLEGEFSVVEIESQNPHIQEVGAPPWSSLADRVQGLQSLPRPAAIDRSSEDIEFRSTSREVRTELGRAFSSRFFRWTATLESSQESLATITAKLENNKPLTGKETVWLAQLDEYTRDARVEVRQVQAIARDVEGLLESDFEKLLSVISSFNQPNAGREHVARYGEDFQEVFARDMAREKQLLDASLLMHRDFVAHLSQAYDVLSDTIVQIGFLREAGLGTLGGDNLPTGPKKVLKVE